MKRDNNIQGGEAISFLPLFYWRVISLEQKRKKYQHKREIFIQIKVDEKERDMIYERIEQSDIRIPRAFLLKMALGRCVFHIELDSVNEIVRLLSNAANNLNQIARRVNQMGGLYAEDIADLQARYDEVWEQTKVILQKLAAM